MARVAGILLPFLLLAPTGATTAPVTVAVQHGTLVVTGSQVAVTGSGAGLTITSPHGVLAGPCAVTGPTGARCAGVDVSRVDLNGTPGADVLSYSGPLPATLAGDAGDDTLTGGDGADVLRGWTGDDVLRGGGGDDTIEGYDGSDRLDGGEGADVLSAGAGGDDLAGGVGDDRLEGNDGDDALTGDAGTDVLDGGAGRDVVRAADGERDIIACDATGPAEDTESDAGDRWPCRPALVPVAACAAAPVVEVGGRVRWARTAGLDHQLELQDAGGTALPTRGRTTQDALRLDPLPALAARLQQAGRVTATAVLTGACGTRTASVALISARPPAVAGRVARRRATERADDLRGTARADRLAGRRGADRLRGVGRDDRLTGNAGDDWLQGGAGDDVLDGGAGADRLEGGAGDDVLRGGTGGDVLDGGEGDDVLDCGPGDDVAVLVIGARPTTVGCERTVWAT